MMTTNNDNLTITDCDKMSKTHVNDSIAEVHLKFQMANIPNNCYISVFSISYQ